MIKQNKNFLLFTKLSTASISGTKLYPILRMDVTSQCISTRAREGIYFYFIYLFLFISRLGTHFLPVCLPFLGEPKLCLSYLHGKCTAMVSIYSVLAETIYRYDNLHSICDYQNGGRCCSIYIQFRRNSPFQLPWPMAILTCRGIIFGYIKM